MGESLNPKELQKMRSRNEVRTVIRGIVNMYEVTVHDLSTLLMPRGRDDGYLNDNIINAFLAILKEKFVLRL